MIVRFTNKDVTCQVGYFISFIIVCFADFVVADFIQSLYMHTGSLGLFVCMHLCARLCPGMVLLSTDGIVDK